MCLGSAEKNSQKPIEKTKKARVTLAPGRRVASSSRHHSPHTAAQRKIFRRRVVRIARASLQASATLPTTYTRNKREIGSACSGREKKERVVDVVEPLNEREREKERERGAAARRSRPMRESARAGSRNSQWCAGVRGVRTCSLRRVYPSVIYTDNPRVAVSVR